ncbi:MAG TPA: SMP-30/gluconolactonase/LRE family protein [Thermoanaerobaculia bacterium]|nr:SMP-30/gluconolactonase/LRE family protein [Thermoanaerobaculia bacterium]
MRKALRIVLWLLAVLVVVGAAWAFYLYASAGQLRDLEERSIGACQVVDGAPGPEDLAVDRARAIALISADDRRSGGGGAIYAYDLEAGGEPWSLTPGREGFHPHGLSLLEANGQSILMVVDHPPAGDSVEVFRWDGSALEPLRTVTDPLLYNLNDVAALDARRFYATNDHGVSAEHEAREDYLRRRRANVVYWDGERARVVADRIGYANGIAVSEDQREVYVASTTFGKILVYDRDEDSGGLVLRKEIALDTGVDNFALDLYGGLWVAAHPHLLTFAGHARDPAKRSPWEVLWVDPSGQAEPSIRPVMLSLGEQLSGASVAVPWGDKLVIGSVFEHLLICQR